MASHEQTLEGYGVRLPYRLLPSSMHAVLWELRERVAREAFGASGAVQALVARATYGQECLGQHIPERRNRVVARQWPELGSVVGRHAHEFWPSVPLSAQLVVFRLGRLVRKCPCFGGEGGIRTHEPREGSPVFKTGAINRSATSPVHAGAAVELYPTGAVFGTQAASRRRRPRAGVPADPL
jgi:hypothetical protein